MSSLSHDGSPYNIETSPLLCSANQLIYFYMTGTSIVKELNYSRLVTKQA